MADFLPFIWRISFLLFGEFPSFYLADFLHFIGRMSFLLLGRFPSFYWADFLPFIWRISFLLFGEFTSFYLADFLTFIWRISFLLFGGGFPGADTTTRSLYVSAVSTTHTVSYNILFYFIFTTVNRYKMCHAVRNVGTFQRVPHLPI